MHARRVTWCPRRRIGVACAHEGSARACTRSRARATLRATDGRRAERLERAPKRSRAEAHPTRRNSISRGCVVSGTSDPSRLPSAANCVAISAHTRTPAPTHTRCSAVNTITRVRRRCVPRRYRGCRRMPTRTQRRAPVAVRRKHPKPAPRCQRTANARNDAESRPEGLALCCAAVPRSCASLCCARGANETLSRSWAGQRLTQLRRTLSLRSTGADYDSRTS